MSLEYILSPNQWFSASITQFSNHQYIQDFMDFMGTNDQVSSVCGNFYGFLSGSNWEGEDIQFSSKLVHEFVMRLVNCGKTNEVWVRLDDYVARFGMQEFCLITGLPCHVADITIDHSNDRLRNLYFNGTKKITMKMLAEVFHLCSDRNDKLKLGLVMLVECVLKPTGRCIDYKSLGMVEHLDEFLAYPWGQKAYFVLLNSLQESQLERVQKMHQSGHAECKYSLHGYPLAFQYWIYEAFPKIGEKFGRRRYKSIQCPRMHRWKPNKKLTEIVVQQFLTTQDIEVVAVLYPTEEELQMVWYTSLSLPTDTKHSLLDGIVNGEFDNITHQMPEKMDVQQTTTPHVYNSSGVGGSSTSGGCNYLTEERMEEMLGTYRQHVVSDVSGLYSSLKAQIDEQSAKQETYYHAVVENQKALFEEFKKWQEGHTQQCSGQSYVDTSALCQNLLDVHFGEQSKQQEAYYQTVLENQRQLFSEQQEWQQGHYQRMQSDIHSYVDMSLGSMRTHVDERNENMMNKLSDWQSNMEAIVGAMQGDVPMSKSEIPTTVLQGTHAEASRERKKRGKNVDTSTSGNALEDYDVRKFKTFSNWMARNPSNAYWEDAMGNTYSKDWLSNLIDTSKELKVMHIEMELKLLRRLIIDGCTLVSKEYAILDFRFETECARQFVWQDQFEQGNASGDGGNMIVLQEYMNGNLPSNSRPWGAYNYLLIPCAYSGDIWYLFVVNFRNWKFEAYDCSDQVHTFAEVKAHANAIFKVVQSLLAWSNFFNERRSLMTYKDEVTGFEVVPNLPCENNGPNCGIFVLKYIECLILRQPIESVAADKMAIYRRKLALDICYNEYFIFPR